MFTVSADGRSIAEISGASSLIQILYDAEKDRIGSILVRGRRVQGGWITLKRDGKEILTAPMTGELTAFREAVEQENTGAVLTWEEATKQHFHAKPESFSYDADWPVWAFINTANSVEYMHPAYKKNFREVKSLEKELNAPISEELKTAKELAKISPEKALNWLHAKNVEKFEKAQEEMAETFAKLTPHEVLVLADAIDSKGDETVNIAILGDKKLKAEDINDSQTVAGPGRSSVGAKVTLSSLAKPTASEVKDVNGDGIKYKV